MMAALYVIEAAGWVLLVVALVYALRWYTS